VYAGGAGHLGSRSHAPSEICALGKFAHVPGTHYHHRGKLLLKAGAVTYVTRHNGAKIHLRAGVLYCQADIVHIAEELKIVGD